MIKSSKPNVHAMCTTEEKYFYQKPLYYLFFLNIGRFKILLTYKFYYLVRAYKLNIDVATMFNPETLATLETYKEQCEICLARMSQTLSEPLDDVIRCDEKQLWTEETI